MHHFAAECAETIGQSAFVEENRDEIIANQTLFRIARRVAFRLRHQRGHMEGDTRDGLVPLVRELAVHVFAQSAWMVGERNRSTQ